MSHFLLLILLPAVALKAAEPADLILSARYVVTMDGSRRVIENGAVAVKGERILAAGPRAEIDAKYRAKARIDRPEALIAPGLINTHTHAAMSLFRGIADDMRLQDWLEQYIFPAEAKMVNPEFVRWGTRLACLEMLLGGTTTFTDMYYFEEVVAEAAKEAGMRGVLGQTIIGFPVADAKTPAVSIARTEAFFKRFDNDPLIVPAIAPHAVYTNSDETLQACRRLADKYNKPLIIHLSETKKENDDLFAKRNTTPTKLLESLGVLTGRTLGAHGVWLDDADMAILKRRGTGLAHCPSSNMKLASGVAQVDKILGLGIAMGLGPDGPAGSNNDFSLFEEMDLAAKLQKVTRMDPQALPATRVVEMATITGARALGLEREIGSIEAGKRADLITVRIDGANAQPLYNVYSALAFSLKGADVNDVVINGRQVVRDKRVLTLNQAAIIAKAGEYAKQVRAAVKR